MDIPDGIDVLSALAQPTRLETFRRLVAAAPGFVPAGELARMANVPQNTMSAHLATLARCGLVHGQRSGRVIGYRADIARLGELMVFLVKDCCGGRPDICAPLAREIGACRQESEAL